jgi:hypothetical protein
MSKLSSYVLQMQEDAVVMTYFDFVGVYGESNAFIWKEVNGEYDYG